jgi:hypothetical protein
MGANPYLPRTLVIKMKKNAIALTVFFTLVPAFGLSKPAEAQSQVQVNPSQVNPNIDEPPPGKPEINTNPSSNPTVPPPLAKPEVGKNTIGPSILLGRGVAIGVDSRFGISENLSLRPFIYFGGNSGTDFGTALTYDINLRTTSSSSKITPFIGGAVDIASGNNTSVTTASLVAGAEYEFTETIQLKAAINVPLSSGQGQSANLTVGAGFRF